MFSVGEFVLEIWYSMIIFDRLEIVLKKLISRTATQFRKQHAWCRVVSIEKKIF